MLFFHIKGVLVKEDHCTAVRALVLDQAVAVDVAAINIVITQRLHGGVCPGRHGQVFKRTVAVAVNVRNDVLLVQLARNKDRRNVLKHV